MQTKQSIANRFCRFITHSWFLLLVVMTAAWPAQAQTLSRVSIDNGIFGFQLPSANVQVLASGNLADWTVTSTGSSLQSATSYVEPATSSQRFFRAGGGTVTDYTLNSTPVFSGIVGYVNLSLSPGYNLIANQLLNETNELSVLIPAPPVDTRCLKCGPAGALEESIFQAGTGWTEPLTLVPGEGAILFTPIAWTNTFVGTVLEGYLTNHVAAGLCLLSSIVPQSGPVTSALGFPAVDGDRLYKFDSTTKNYHRFTYNATDGWLNEALAPEEPVIQVGEPFWVQTTTARDWVRLFSPNAFPALPAFDGPTETGYSTTVFAYTGGPRPMVPPSGGAYPPLLIAQPQSRTNIPGANVTFNVTASGFPAPSYQWCKNGTNIAGATDSSLTFASAQLPNSGTYSVIVSNAVGCVTSAPAGLTIVADAKAPTVVLATPIASRHYTNNVTPVSASGLMTFTGSASDDYRVTHVLLSLNGGGFTPATLSAFTNKVSPC